MKVGRNELCPCGSGKKFKKCHLALPKSILLPRPTMPMRPNYPPDLIKRANEMFEKQRIKEEERVRKFGMIRPIIYAAAFGESYLVTVGGNLYQTTKKSTFTNFIFNYGLLKLGDEWREAQNQLPLAEQHPLFVLHCRANHFTSRQPVRPEGYVTVVPNGPLSFCERFYYDLYIVDDNNILDDELLHRLRHKDQFQGAMHELFVEATCLRAGFSIVREKFSGPKPKNVEFIAIHKETQQHISIEAKSRSRPGIMGKAGTPVAIPDMRFGGLINNAAAKDPCNPLAVFIDTNLPADKAELFYTPISREPMVMSERIGRLANLVRAGKDFDPYNLLVFTNHPQHYGEDGEKAPKDQWGALTSNNPRVKVFHEKALKDLIRAVEFYGNIPTNFPKLIPGTNLPE